eukprot:GEMP01013021.1.p1 GENE.GEMP01013021.1~~GEMP01013021.1.p1  ORF type:complete len:168 (+),score=22.14 GEMP01013021.1:444-947(+)
MGCCHGTRTSTIRPAMYSTPAEEITDDKDFDSPRVSTVEWTNGTPPGSADVSFSQNADERISSGTPELDWDWENPCLELPGWLSYNLHSKKKLTKAGDTDDDSSGGMSDISPCSISCTTRVRLGESPTSRKNNASKQLIRSIQSISSLPSIPSIPSTRSITSAALPT